MIRLGLRLLFISILTIISGVTVNLFTEEAKTNLEPFLGRNYPLFIVGATFLFGLLAIISEQWLNRPPPQHQTNLELLNGFSSTWLRISTELHSQVKEIESQAINKLSYLDRNDDSISSLQPLSKISLTTNEIQVLKNYDLKLGVSVQEFAESIIWASSIEQDYLYFIKNHRRQSKFKVLTKKRRFLTSIQDVIKNANNLLTFIERYDILHRRDTL